MQLSWLIRKIFILLIIFSLGVSAPAFAAGEMQTKAEYAILMDPDGVILFDKNSDIQMGPASMTKLMTLYLLFDALKTGEISLNSEFPVSEKAWRKGGSKMFVKEGTDVKVEDLIRGIIIHSGNDACIVVAEGISGSEDAFAEDMNFMASKLGLEGSHFRNSTGWPDPDHYMTSRDLAILAQHLINDFPEYYHYFAEKTYEYNNIKQSNRNGLLYRGIGVDGLKTGHTEDSGYGIVASSVQDGRRLIVVVNGLANAKERVTEAERLLRHGYRDFKNIELYKKGDVIDSIDVWFGEKKKINLVAQADIGVLQKRRLSKKEDIKMAIAYRSPLVAPIKKGDHIANLVIKKDDKIEKVLAIKAHEDINKLSFIRRMFAVPKYVLFGN